MFTVFVVSCSGGFVYVAAEENASSWKTLSRPLFNTHPPQVCDLVKTFDARQDAVMYMYSQTCQSMITSGSFEYVRCDAFQFLDYTYQETNVFLRMLYTTMLGTYLPVSAFSTFATFADKINFKRPVRSTDDDSRRDDSRRSVSYRDVSYRDSSRPVYKCTHCNKLGHSESKCYIKHPELRPSYAPRYSDGGIGGTGGTGSLPLTTRDVVCALCGVAGHTAVSCPSRTERTDALDD